jgi:hypothetical protein
VPPECQQDVSEPVCTASHLSNDIHYYLVLYSGHSELHLQENTPLLAPSVLLHSSQSA